MCLYTFRFLKACSVICEDFVLIGSHMLERRQNICTRKDQQAPVDSAEHFHSSSKCCHFSETSFDMRTVKNTWDGSDDGLFQVIISQKSIWSDTSCFILPNTSYSDFLKFSLKHCIYCRGIFRRVADNDKSQGLQILQIFFNTVT